MIRDAVPRLRLFTPSYLLGLLVFSVLLCGFPSYARAYTITTTSDTTNIGSTGYNSAYDLEGQTITTVGAGTFSSASICVAKVGSPGDNIELKVYAVSGGFPTGAALATSDAISGAALPTSCTGHGTSFSFSTPVTLDATTEYAFVLDRTGSNSTSDYYDVFGSSSNPYNDGHEVRYDTGSWTAPGGGLGDINMEVEITASGGGSTGQFLLYGCVNSATGTDCYAATTTAGYLKVNDVGNVPMGLALLVFFQGLIAVDMAFNVIKGFKYG